ncbi:aromatic amino acid lyase [Ramlibacter sp. G-1-2-2]|uniref:Aromatic amino acid lyase n=1 Tax=Ramlibacter agri TaxID=2728837 RepID=A0A848H425_9BURK|nr:aromatic amino acid lyase [Ramlibacter agri]NML44492.1 aromatic amino acid lyase [Ramlibacter agri]
MTASTHPVTLGSRLTVDDVVRVARQHVAVAPLGPEAVARMQRSAQWVEQVVRDVAGGSSHRAYYGINTGFGAQAGRSTLGSPHLTEVLGRNLIASHCVGVGAWLPEEAVRATLLVRAQSLAQGFSGVRPELVAKLVAMLNAGVYPAVPEQGSLGASGDLAPLAHIALMMTAPPAAGSGDAPVDATDGEAFVRCAALPGAAVDRLHIDEDYESGTQSVWQRVPGAQAMREAGGQIALRAKEALALLNGATVSAALAALVVRDMANLLANAELAVAACVECIGGFRDPFFPQVHEARGHEAAGRAARNILGYLEGSELADPGDLHTDPQRVPPQDPYCVRCAPQVLGTAEDTLALARRWVEMDLNAATDNPLVFPALARDYKAVSGGNFHGEPIALAMDFLAIAATEVASLSERRMFTLCELPAQRFPEQAGNRFLIAEPRQTAGLNSGLMMLQATAAALVSDCKVLAHPDSVDSIPSSGNQEDHVSMSLNAALHARKVLRNAETVVALELLCAAQGLHLRTSTGPGDGGKPGRGGAAVRDVLRKSGWEPVERDRVMQEDIRLAIRLVRSGAFLQRRTGTTFPSEEHP